MSNDAADELRERFDGFNYPYRMKCTCGRASLLTAADYHREVDHAHTLCTHCGARIHFGPAVTALRNDDDPALDGHHVAAFAWYHTSTAPDWPSVTHAPEVAEQMRQMELIPRAQREYFTRLASTKALHLGTYEAAVENLLRRMHDEGDAGSQFYLHRVAVRPGRVNDGYRDENCDRASDITVGELEADGLDAVRYLNVYEAPGSLSLAVRPGTIRWVQSLPIPVVNPAGNELPASLATLVRGVDAAALTHVRAEERVKHLPRLQRLLWRRDPDSNPDLVAAHDAEAEWRRQCQNLDDSLCRHYLPNVSEPVRKAVVDALRSRPATRAPESADGSAHEFARSFAAMAELLEHPRNVVAAVTARPRVPVRTTFLPRTQDSRRADFTASSIDGRDGQS